jgi:hypothetical protein
MKTTRVVTSIGEAFVNACAKSGGPSSKHWVARAIADRAMHTQLGTQDMRTFAKKERNDRPSAAT